MTYDPSSPSGEPTRRVVARLRESGAQSRRELADTGLSRSTVKSVVEELLDAGTVVEVAGPKDARGRPAADPRRPQGRPRPRGRRTRSPTGVVRAAVSHRAGAPAARLWCRWPTTPRGGDAQDVGTLIAHMLDGSADPAARCSARSRDARADPGAAAETAGDHPQAVGDGDAHGRRRRRPADAARGGNDANFAAWPITWGAARGLRDVAYVYTASGIGAGFILDGSLYVGATARPASWATPR